jgi:hypothetical protein
LWVSDDIYLDATPCLDNQPDSTLGNSTTKVEDTTCHHLTAPSKIITTTSEHTDNLLRDLRQYYASVKTKRQLNMDVPAGFRKSNAFQQDYNQFIPPKNNLTPASDSSFLSNITSVDDLPTCSNDPTTGVKLNPTLIPVTNSSSQVNVPILRCVDKCSSYLPRCVTFTEDFLRSSVGFCRIDTIKCHLKELFQDTY